MSGNDLSVLYLIASEIAESFNAEIKPYHHGYLIYSGNDWAILLEHGSFLVGLDDSAKLINQLAEEFQTVYLGSCNSFIYSQYHKNVVGFRGNIQVEELIECLIEQLSYKNTIHQLLYCTLREYTLGVIPRTFNIGIRRAIAFGDLIFRNSFFSMVNILNPFQVDLQPGENIIGLSGNWGAAHINAKYESQYINNDVIEEILKGKGVFGFVFKQPLDNYYSLTLFKIYADATQAKFVSILIGLPGRTPIVPGTYPMFTIRTADAAYFKQQIALSMAEAIYHAENHNCKSKDVKRRFGYVITLGTSQAPEILAALEAAILLGLDDSGGSGDPNQGLTAGEWFAKIWPILLGVLAVGFCALPKLLSPFIQPPEYMTISTSTKMSSVIGEPDEGSWSDYEDLDPIIDDAIEMEYQNQYYDDDNDGLSNAFEESYFEAYVEDYFASDYEFIPDCPIPDDFTEEDKYTWLDPNSDMDFDGLLTITEAQYNSNPFVVDTDGDGLNDSEELWVEDPPFQKELFIADLDRDGDLDSQILMVQDVEYRSDPASFDSDFDGLGDNEEDGMNDGWEVYTHAVKWEGGDDENYTGFYDDLVNPMLAQSSAWASEDTDSDGLNNSIESRIFSNPYDEDTDDDGIPDYDEYINNLDPTQQILKMQHMITTTMEYQRY
ncbi:MAG: hypothetical protein ACTSSK_13065 [Candidatus Heimdallarchaeota archaeon]